MVNRKRLITLTRKLISINSENPPGNEYGLARFVKHYLANIGVKAKIYEFQQRRANVVALLGESKNKPSLLVTPHLDTVPAGKSWKMNPFRGIIKRDKIYGLGATDCKGNLAGALEAINSIVEEGVVLRYNLIFAATADEESGSGLGLVPLLDKGILKPDAALVLDADDFRIIVTQKGLMHLKIKIKGKRAHGAYPQKGINAIDKAIDIIKDIKARRVSYKRNKYLKAPTVNIGTIRGGDKVNVVADWCEFELDFRFLPGSDAKDMLKELKSIIARHVKKFNLEIEGIQEPYAIAESHPLVTNLVDSMRKFKLRPIIKGSEGATVITFFQNKNVPAVAFGFGSEDCAHTADEYAKIDNLHKGALVLEEFLKNYKGDSNGRN